jgi:L-lactate dehydrogenase complex protein LldG
MTTRAEFMARLRGEMARARPGLPARAADRPRAPVEVADALRRELSERWRETRARFHAEFERVGGVFWEVAEADQVADLVAALARERQGRRVVTWHRDALGLDLEAPLAARGLDARAMPEGGPPGGGEASRLRDLVAAADLGVTGVDLAVAETGTLVLRAGPGRPRSTSLLPPVHVALLDRAALIESLVQLGVFLEAWHGGAPGPDGAAINLITGPSRTADIELTLTRGVHGPREVHAVFVEGGIPAPSRG